jgi:hypothetical protein
MWYYLYFLILIKVKDKTEFTGPESFVYSCIQVIFKFFNNNFTNIPSSIYFQEKKFRLVSSYESNVT